MDWIQILTILATFLTSLGVLIGIYFKLDTKIDAKIDGLATKIEDLRKDFQQETKDFHARLCVLESRYLDIREKELKIKP